jgi:glycosyltransferase involved in cell wall biosynthesis
MPSHHEPWGLVVNEALASGLPVIATDNVGCIDDLISNNGQGLIIPSKNMRALFEAMGFMLANPVKKRLMAKHAAETIQSWTLKNEAGNMMAVWKSVIVEQDERAYS